jgi:hypothetical protein
LTRSINSPPKTPIIGTTQRGVMIWYSRAPFLSFDEMTDCSPRILKLCWRGRVYRFRFRGGSWRWEHGREYIFVNLGRLLIDVLLLLLSRENNQTATILQCKSTLSRSFKHNPAVKVIPPKRYQLVEFDSCCFCNSRLSRAMLNVLTA